MKFLEITLIGNTIYSKAVIVAWYHFYLFLSTLQLDFPSSHMLIHR